MPELLRKSPHDIELGLEFCRQFDLEPGVTTVSSNTNVHIYIHTYIHTYMHSIACRIRV